ncbi:MAG: DsbA family oxidoreductase [Balneolaceae bacterium]|nr:DsbA family oxidoreductase [Balneolaceae bacterium]
MKIEIWSDIACPFCYIGKRHLEQALDQFKHADEVDVVWHSFELDPEAKTETDKNIYEKLASKYGQSLEWAKQANEDLKQKAADVGIEFNPEKIIPTNSFDAHRLIKLADEYGLEDEAEEQLFNAYFTEGKNISNYDTLRQIGATLGLGKDDVETMLESEQYSDDVRRDEKEAQQIGVRGVPFFVLNRKYAISGAQPVHTFVEALEKCYADEQKQAVEN